MRAAVQTAVQMPSGGSPQDRTYSSVLVFKTSVKNSFEATLLKPALNALTNDSEKWNFDLEDCDRILRVETMRLNPNRVIEVLNRNGFHCEELED